MKKIKQYMVFIEGKSAPRKIHDNVIDAGVEAERLGMQIDNLDRKIYVLKVKQTFISSMVFGSYSDDGDCNE